MLVTAPGRAVNTACAGDFPTNAEKECADHAARGRGGTACGASFGNAYRAGAAERGETSITLKTGTIGGHQAFLCERSTQECDEPTARLVRHIYLGGYSGPYYGIQTIKGNYLTAVGAGGKYADALHTDAKQIQSWELFRVVKCGDPGSGYEYGVMAADGEFLAATNWEGKPGFGLNNHPTESEMKYKLIRQSDATYALQTANGRNYITALGGRRASREV